MLEWIKANFELVAGHEEGVVHSDERFFVAYYQGDGCWHLFDRETSAPYSFETTLAHGCGLSALKCALGLHGWLSASRRECRP
jgi:hypothetical protein